LEAAAGAANGSQFLTRASWCRNSVSAASRALGSAMHQPGPASSLPLCHASTGEQLGEENDA